MSEKPRFEDVSIEVDLVNSRMYYLELALHGFDEGKTNDKWTESSPASAFVQLGAGCDLLLGTGFARLSGLYVPVPARGLGYGRALVQRAQEFADRHGLSLYADVVPYGDRPLSEALLFAWYRRQGFTRYPGHPYAMVWTPNTSIEGAAGDGGVSH